MEKRSDIIYGHEGRGPGNSVEAMDIFDVPHKPPATNILDEIGVA